MTVLPNILIYKNCQDYLYTCISIALWHFIRNNIYKKCQFSLLLLVTCFIDILMLACTFMYFFSRLSFLKICQYKLILFAIGIICLNCHFITQSQLLSFVAMAAYPIFHCYFCRLWTMPVLPVSHHICHSHKFLGNAIDNIIPFFTIVIFNECQFSYLHLLLIHDCQFYFISLLSLLLFFRNAFGNLISFCDCHFYQMPVLLFSFAIDVIWDICHYYFIRNAIDNLISIYHNCNILLLMSFVWYANFTLFELSVFSLSEMPLIIWSLLVTTVIYCYWFYLWNMSFYLVLIAIVIVCQKWHW